MKTVLAALGAHPKTKAARLVVITPVPIVEARLDKWSKDRFTNSEANSKAVVEAFRKAAAENRRGPSRSARLDVRRC